MGIYAGFLYNECFSIPFNFGTTWIFNGTNPLNASSVSPINFPPWNTSNPYANPKNTFYWFGVDPAWKGSLNELNYYNSLKMKLSIIMGVSQMILGIILSLFNAIHFRKVYDALFEFVPQILFMLALFGYMSLLVVAKWVQKFITTEPPLIMNIMINMFLHPGTLLDTPLIDATLQKYLQICLLLLAFVCVPWMLVPKPLLLYLDHRRQYRALPQQPHLQVQPPPAAGAGKDHDVENRGGPVMEPILAPPHASAALASGGGGGGGGDEHGHGEFDFSEILVHQVIHTIEFVLGAISNTASYLRLWALSLAHAELSYVFWALIFIKGMKLTSLGNIQFVALFVCFSVWAALTIFVLLIMESLSAFLHALRLHWVEFQNKFYHGDGKQFLPFSYDSIFADQ